MKMMDESNPRRQPEPFEVTDQVIDEVRDDPPEMHDLEGYHGHPIKGVGDVYTPKHIVDFILDSIDYSVENDIENQVIIDLSCGTGSFIREIVRRLRNRLIKSGLDPSVPSDASEILSTVVKNVYASDLKALAIWRTAQVMIDELMAELETVGVDNPIGELNFYNTDSLHPEFMFDTGGFDFVVGNPPYIRNSEIDSELDEFYRKKYATAEGKYDIYSVFFERGFDLLEPDGKLGFVTPDRFFRTNYGKPLRKLLTSQSSIELIINLQDDPFPLVNAYPIITILKRRSESFPRYQSDDSFVYCEVDSESLSIVRRYLEQPNGDLEGNCTRYSQSDLDGEPWNLLEPEVKNLKERLENRLLGFHDLRMEIKAGVATGADDVFIMEKKTADELEDELLEPIIRGRDVGKGKINWTDTYLINPYKRDKSIIDIANYPNTKKYLEDHRQRLEDRYCVREAGKYWYETHDTIDTNREKQRKIVTPDIVSDTQFAIAEGFVCHNTCYSIYYHGDLEHVLGYLNSDVFEFFLKSTLPEMDGGHWRQMKRDLQQLSVIDPSVYDQESYHRMKKFVEAENWAEANELVYDLLDINDSDRELITSYLRS